MLDILKQKLASSGEVVAVCERPAVLEAKRKCDEHRVKRDEAKQHLTQLQLLLAPATDSSSVVKGHVDEVTILRASAQLPQVRLAYIEAEAQLKASEQEFQRIVQVEARSVTEERVNGRRVQVQELFALLDVAVAMTEQIQVYDDETRRLGGVPPLPPVGELLSDTYRQNFVEANRSVLKKEGWL